MMERFLRSQIGKEQQRGGDRRLSARKSRSARFERLEDRRLFTVTESTVHDFAGGTADGEFSFSTLTADGSTLYGTTERGGANNEGVLFSINASGGDYQVLYSFSGSETPTGALTLVGSKLYGTTSDGGTYDDGTIFSMTTTGTDFTVLHSFDGTDGASPPEEQLALDGSTLYGTTTGGGTIGKGTIFKIDTSDDVFESIYSFSSFSTGIDPTAGVTVVGSKLYGTVSAGGPDGVASGGGIFSVNADGTDYGLLHPFAEDYDPKGGLILSGTTLYGTTSYDGLPPNLGTVFSFDTNTDDLTTLHTFSGTDGQDPSYEDLVLVGTTLFGTTGEGSGGGTVFSVSTTGTDFQSLHAFSDSEVLSGVTVVGTTLLGTTISGGAHDDGVVYSISGVVPYIAVTPSGSTANFTVGGSAVDVDSGVTVSSSDTDLTGATATISSGTLQTDDTLSFTSPSGSGITGSYSGGVLTLAGSATPALYQAALQSVTFSTTSTNTTTRSISIVASDSTDSLSSNSAVESVGVAVPAPVVTASGATASYTAGAAAVAIDSGVTVYSYDASLTGATITISSGTRQSGDALGFTSPTGSGITGSYSSGMLTLTGTASLAQYQAALQSVTFSSTSTSTATRSISIVADDSNSSPAASSAAPESVNVSAPVTVTGVYVVGSAWTSAFNSYLGTNGFGNSTTPSLGYALQFGANQLTTLPWTNIDTIEVQFSGAVSVVEGSLELSGGSGGSTPTVTGFSSLGSNTYEWTLSGALTNNQYLISVASTTSSFGTAVTDANGAGVDGEFTTSSSSFPSGNGLAGGTFNFFFNVLPGDVNQSSTVTSADTSVVSGDLGKTTRSLSGYNPYADVDGSGTITSGDTSAVNAELGAALARNTPAAPSLVEVGGTSFADVALAVQETSNQAATSNSTSVVTNIVPASELLADDAAETAEVSADAPGGTAIPSIASTATASGKYHDRATDAAVSSFDLADLYV